MAQNIYLNILIQKSNDNSMLINVQHMCFHVLGL